MAKKRILILGGGFGGVYTAMELERRLKEGEAEVTLVSRENFHVFTPMLHEVAASELGPANVVNPVCKLLKSTGFFCGSVDSINLDSKSVEVSHGDLNHSHTLQYDHLVLALGSVTHFRGLPGESANLIGMKTLGDAIYLRNRMISLMQEANFECCEPIRKSLLSFVVAGGGFAGVETVSAIIDFLHDTLSFYPNLSKSDFSVVLVNSGKFILPELSASLGRYAGNELESRGVKILTEERVRSFEDGKVILNSLSEIPCRTLIWTAGNICNPLLEKISCQKENGRILVSEELFVSSYPDVWALGDCAAIPNGSKGYHPPTAQHAIRQAKILAFNLTASIRNQKLKKFRFNTLGQLASIGRKKGVAEILGIRFSGFIAWLLWKSIYIMKLPRAERRLRVLIEWILDGLFPKDTVQINTGRTKIDSERSAIISS